MVAFPKPIRSKKERKPLKRSGYIARRKRLPTRRKTKRRSERIENPAYLAVLRTRECVAGPGGFHADGCMGSPCEPSHLGPRPRGRKADDDTAVSQTRECHDAWEDHRFPFNIPREERRSWAGWAIFGTRAEVYPILARAA